MQTVAPRTVDAPTLVFQIDPPACQRQVAECGGTFYVGGIAMDELAPEVERSVVGIDGHPRVPVNKRPNRAGMVPADRRLIKFGARG